jgi:hypothetical protein
MKSRTVSVCILALALVWPTAANAAVLEKTAPEAPPVLLSSWTSGPIPSLPVGHPWAQSPDSLSVRPTQAPSDSSTSWIAATRAAEESILSLGGPAALSPESLPDVPLTNHSGVMYLTSTGHLWVDGIVYNPYRTAFCSVPIAYQFVDEHDNVVFEASGYASTWRLGPGESKSFKRGFYRPGAAAENLHVHVSITGDLEWAPPPVVLTPVSESVVDRAGIRTLTCVFRNDSEYALMAQYAGGWELDAGGALVNSLGGFDVAQIPPGATWTADFTDFQEGKSVASRYYYCEAKVVEGPLRAISVAGGNRIDTAIQASKKGFSAGSADTVLVATAMNWPDARL